MGSKISHVCVSIHPRHLEAVKRYYTSLGLEVLKVEHMPDGYHITLKGSNNG